MNPRRFIPRVELIEARLAPAGLNVTGLNLTPQVVFDAAALASTYYEGTRFALQDQSFIRQAGNRAAVTALNAVQIAQAPILATQLGGYATELRAEQAADPDHAAFFSPFIERYDRLAAQATAAGVQAQAITDRIAAFNAADAAQAAAARNTTTGTGTGTSTGGLSTGVNGLNGLGTNTGTNNTLPTQTGTNGGTTTNTNTGTNGVVTPSTTGTTTGNTTGTPGTTTDSTVGNTGGTTTGSGTGTTP